MERVKQKERSRDNNTLLQQIDALRESDDFTRARIIEKLIAFPSRTLVERIIRLLDDKNTPLRMDVLDVLKKTGHCCIGPIIQLLYHENEDLRVYGCEVLSTLKNKDSLHHLIQKVWEDTDNVRNAAVMALGEFNDERAIDALLKVLGEEEWIAFSAVCSLEKIGNKRAVPALLEMFKNREEEMSLAACEALMAFKDEHTIDEIVNFIGALEKGKMSTFIKVVVDRGDDQIIGKLMKKMGDQLLGHLLNYQRMEKKKSLKVARVLVHFGVQQSVQAILEILKNIDPEEDEFEEALQLLIQLKHVWEQNTGDYLEVEENRLAMIRACGEVGCKIGEPSLLSVFTSSSRQIKREIMKQFREICDGDGYSVIRAALHDADGHVQADAVAAAGIMGLNELKEDILKMVKEGYVDVRTKALIALLRIDPSTALEAVEGFVSEGTVEDKKIFLAVTSYVDGDSNYPLLKRLLADPNEQIRQITVRIIGNYVGDERYLNLFRIILESGSIPNEILKVIGEKKLTGFRKFLMDIFLDPLRTLWTRYHALVALAAFKERSLFNVFVDALKDENNLIKIGALKGLSELNDKQAVPRIRPYTKSVDEDVKGAAQIALARLSRSEGAC